LIEAGLKAAEARTQRPFLAEQPIPICHRSTRPAQDLQGHSPRCSDGSRSMLQAQPS
jgi:hypothetical protein